MLVFFQAAITIGMVLSPLVTSRFIFHIVVAKIGKALMMVAGLDEW